MEFPIYRHREGGRNIRFSLNPIEIPQQTYPNPLLIALKYKEALESRKYRNQTELAKSLNVIPVESSGQATRTNQPVPETAEAASGDPGIRDQDGGTFVSPSGHGAETEDVTLLGPAEIERKAPMRGAAL